MGYTEKKFERITKGLRVEQRIGAAVLKIRASYKGKTFFASAGTTDWDRARRTAISKFARWQRDVDAAANGVPLSEHVTMHEAAKGAIAEIKKPVRRAYHGKQWSSIKDFFIGVDVDAVDTPMLKKFVRECRQKNEEHTVSKKVITVRKILQHAAEEGWITAMPVFPKLDRIEHNPRPWLDKDEYAHLLRVAEERVEEAAGNDRVYRQRQDLLDFVRMAVATYARVDELRYVRVRDCKVETVKDKEMLAWFREEARLNQKEERARKPSPAYTESVPVIKYLFMEVTGKRGTRPTRSRAALPIFEAVVKRKGLGPDDYLWAVKPGASNPEHHRDGFRELLIAAKLREKRISGKDVTRNLKSLRCTGLMMTVLEKKKNANYKAIADNAGTSLAMLEQFYLKPLHLHVNPEEVL